MKSLFIDAPDRTNADFPPLQELREKWKVVHATLMGHLMKLAATEWFTRHANIAEADFANEPHRNRLNVLLTRTTHLAYHRGQLVLLAKSNREA